MSDLPTPPSPPDRPHVPGAAVALALVTGVLTVLGVVCCGGGLVLGVVSLEPELARVRSKLESVRETDELLDAARAQLADLAAVVERARARSREYPPVLPEAPPQDPWGTPVLYERLAPDRAVLRSAGPDRELGTHDDVRLDLP
jgi:hypothetical protein